jgi:uncharacterized protein
VTLRHLTPSDYKSMPWANGRGTTVELFRQEDADGALLLRLSCADVVEAGAFSSLPGIDRILTLIEGAGFDLDFGEQGSVTPVLPFEPVAFSGDWPAAAERVRGPSRDFNVMVARGRLTAEVTVLRDGPAVLDGKARSFLYVAQGHVAIESPGYPQRIASNELLVIDAETALALPVTVSGCALKIDITAF